MRTFAEKLQELVEYCRLYDQKTFVFGARKTAMLTMRFLEKHGIVPGVVVNRAYLQEAKQNNPHHECIALEDLPQICREGERINIVIGFCGFRWEQIFPYRHCVARVFAYDFLGATCLWDGTGDLHLLTEDFLIAHGPELDSLRTVLQDDLSREALDAYLMQRMYGHYAKPCDPDQYFDKALIHLRDGEVFVDCGAFSGDTVEAFAHYMREAFCSYDKILAFEPAQENRAALVARIQKEALCDVEVIPKAVWSECGEIRFEVDAGSTVGRIDTDGGTLVPATTLDEEVFRLNVSPTFLKLDVEGAELPILQGARHLIETYHPRIVCAVYHHFTDLLTIPQYLQSLGGYEFYLRNHAEAAVELDLYAIPR